MVQTAGIEPATSGPKSGALPLSYIRDPKPPQRRRIQGGKAACTGGDKSSNRCARFGFRDRERAYSPCDGLSQAILLRVIRGVFQWWLFGNTATVASGTSRTVRPDHAGFAFRIRRGGLPPYV